MQWQFYYMINDMCNKRSLHFRRQINCRLNENQSVPHADKGSPNFALVPAELLRSIIVNGTAITPVKTTKDKVVISGQKCSSLHAILPGDGRTGCWLRKG